MGDASAIARFAAVVLALYVTVSTWFCGVSLLCSARCTLLMLIMLIGSPMYYIQWETTVILCYDCILCLNFCLRRQRMTKERTNALKKCSLTCCTDIGGATMLATMIVYAKLTFLWI